MSDENGVRYYREDIAEKLAALAVAEAIRKLSPTNEQINEAALVWANHHSDAPDKDCPDWLIHDYEAGAYFVRECYGVLNKVTEATKEQRAFTIWCINNVEFESAEETFLVDNETTIYSFDDLKDYWIKYVEQ